MDINDLRGKSRADQFKAAAEYAGVPPELFDGIWATESSRGRAMRSPAGARGHFGIMPTTQKTWEQRKGVALNPDDFADGLYIAALTLKENLNATQGNVGDALRMYNAGTNRRRWVNPETQAYVGKVMKNAGSGAEYVPVTKQNDNAWTRAEILAASPTQLANMGTGKYTSDKDFSPRPHVQTVNELTRQALGFQSSYTGIDNTVDTSAEERSTAQGTAEKEFRDSQTAWDKFSASFRDNTASAFIWRAMTTKHQDADPNFASVLINDRSLLAEAQSEDEYRDLLRSDSMGEYKQRLQALKDRRMDRQVYMSGGKTEGLLWGLAGGVADPVGWLAGFGIGKGLQVVGVGSRALAIAGKPLLAATSLTAENVIGNVGLTAMQDALGEYRSPNDYAFAAGIGGLIGVAQSPFHIRGVVREDTARLWNAQKANSAMEQAQTMAEAQKNLGPNATPEQLVAEAARIDAQKLGNNITAGLTELPDAERFMPSSPDNIITTVSQIGPDGKEVKVETHAYKDIEARYDLAAIPEDVERAQVAEIIAQSDRIASNLPDNKPYKTILSKLTGTGKRGMESTGTTLAASDSNVLRATAASLLEGTTGQLGRRRTAAMQMHIRERMYAQAMDGYDEFYHVFRKEKGVSVAADAWDGNVRREFNRRVAYEIESRGGKFVSGETHPAILKAADRVEEGFDLMRREQQAAGVVGSARLKESSVGYFPHKMDPKTVDSLAAPQAKAIRELLSSQFQASGWTRELSDKVAARYMQTAREKRYSTMPVPVQLHSPEAAGIIEDAMEALGIKGLELKDLMGKYSRGGAEYTKKRLQLDLSMPIPDPDGKVRDLKLMDLFNTDVPGMYRQYARRAAGEVALANHGVHGKQGLKMMRQAALAQGATPGELEAFDQIAAEFLNTSFGSNNHRYMDNIRTMNSVINLGGMGFTQLGEYANGIAAVGLHRTFAAIGAMPRMLKEVGQLKKDGHAKNPILNSMESYVGAFGQDDFQLTRMFDVPDNSIQLYGSENIGVGTRMIRAAGYAQSIASFHRAITATQIRGFAEQVTAKAMWMIRNGTDDVALRDMGITKDLQAAFKEDLKNIAKFDSRGRLTELNFDRSTMSRQQLAEFSESVLRGSSQIIQNTYIGETGKWAHDGLLKLLFQFRTFGLTSVEKQWGRQVQNVGAARAFGYLIGSMSLAAPLTIARIHMKTIGMSRSEREEYLHDKLQPVALARQVMNYTAMSGLAGDTFDIGAGFAGGWFGDGEGSVGDALGVRKGGNNLLGGTVAPSLNTVEQGWKAVHGDTKAMLRMTPGANLPYIQPFLNLIKSED